MYKAIFIGFPCITALPGAHERPAGRRNKENILMHIKKRIIALFVMQAAGLYGMMP